MMEKEQNKFPLWQRILTTGFGSGLSPVAPGTMGALLACAIYVVMFLTMPFYYCQILTLVLILLFTALGIPASTNSEKVWGEDPSRVVVDEMVGVWIPLLAVANGSHWYWYVLAAFLLFRFFDILKPMGVRAMERLGGGLGIMMDDILAGIYSLVLIVAYRLIAGV